MEKVITSAFQHCLVFRVKLIIQSALLQVATPSSIFKVLVKHFASEDTWLLLQCSLFIIFCRVFKNIRNLLVLKSSKIGLGEFALSGCPD